MLCYNFMKSLNKKHSLLILFFTILLDMIGVGMIIPIIPIIFTDPTSPAFLLHGFSTQMQLVIAGSITALSGIMTFFAAPILGELSDLYGRKKLLAACILVLALSQIFFAVGVLISSLTILFISRIVAGLASANISIAQASIADITEPKDRAKNFGLIGVAVGIGFIVGPALGGYIAALSNNASLPFFFAGALGLINLISVTFFLPETHTVPESKKHSITIFKALHNIKSAFNKNEASHLYTSNFLYFFGFTFFTSSTGIYLVQKFAITESGLGTYFGVLGMWIVITQGVILRIITKKYSEKQILRYSVALVGTMILLMPIMPSVIFMYILLPFIAIPQGLSMANLNALISKSVSPDKQGAAMGINASLSALAQGLVPALSGFVSALFGLSFPYLVAGICMLLAWYNLIIRKRNTTVY